MSGRFRVSRDEIQYSDDSENDYDRGHSRGRRGGGERRNDPVDRDYLRQPRSGGGRKRDEEEGTRRHSKERDWEDDRGGSRHRSDYPGRRSRDALPPSSNDGRPDRWHYEDDDEEDYDLPPRRATREPRSRGWDDTPSSRRSTDPRDMTRPEGGSWNDASRTPGGRGAKRGFTAPRDLASNRGAPIVVENIEDSESDNDVVPHRSSSRYSRDREEHRSRARREPPAEERPRYPPASREPRDPHRRSQDRGDGLRSSVNSEVGAPIRASRDYDRRYDEDDEDPIYQSRESSSRDREPKARRGRSRDDPVRVRETEPLHHPPFRPHLVREDSNDVISLSDDSDDIKRRGRRDREPPAAVAVAQPVAEAQNTSFGYSTAETNARTIARYDTRDNSDELAERRAIERQSLPSYVMTAHESGGYTELVQCLIVRDKPGVLDGGGYNLFVEDTNKLILYAQKKSMSRTSNYHIFDMTRPVAGKVLSKKSGNYIGKLRALNLTSTDYVLVTAASEREEVAGISYDQVSLLDQMKEGSQPRRVNVMVPTIDADSIPVPNHVGRGVPSMIDLLKSSENGKMFVFNTKEPKFENGNYRLNFHGRVSVPSVKNFQLSSRDEPDHVVCQFGKVGDDRFHLDFKAPLNAFQAFAIALTQFNI